MRTSEEDGKGFNGPSVLHLDLAGGEGRMVGYNSSPLYPLSFEELYLFDIIFCLSFAARLL